jgi:membrane-bound ClpP family serine protease
MGAKVTIEVDQKFEGIMLRALAMAEEMEQLALTAPDGTVFGACESAVVEKGRTFQAHVLGEAVARRVETAEKKGRQSACASADVRKKTEAPKNGG